MTGVRSQPCIITMKHIYGRLLRQVSLLVKSYFLGGESNAHTQSSSISTGGEDECSVLHSTKPSGSGGGAGKVPPCSKSKEDLKVVFGTPEMVVGSMFNAERMVTPLPFGPQRQLNQSQLEQE